jgi:S-layer family protein
MRVSWMRLLAAMWMLLLFLGAGFRLLADCASFGLPFTDLGSGSGFCAAVAEAYYSGLTNGTTATTYSPAANVTRIQMAAFITRTLDQSLLRGSRRAALDQWWTQTPHFDKAGLGLTSVGPAPQLLKSDGLDIWVPNSGSDNVSRVRASDGAVLGTWTGATAAEGVLVAIGKVFVTGQENPGLLYMIDPSSGPTAVTTLGEGPEAIRVRRQ